MKFRSDFVTNSSSCGYIAITINLKNGKKILFEDNYNTGYGGYFWNGGLFEDSFDSVENGSDILNVIKECVEDFRFFELSADYQVFAENCKMIKSRNELSSIEMEEDTTFDDGDEKSWAIDYKFSANKGGISLVAPDKIRDIVIPVFCSVGILSLVNWDNTLECPENKMTYVTDFSKYASYHHWLYKGDLRNYIEKCELFGHKPFINFCVVSDELVKKINSGKNDRSLMYAARLQKELGFCFVGEKEFLNLGDYKLPKSINTNIQGKRIKVTGESSEYPLHIMKRKVKELGGIVVAGDVKKDNVDMVVYCEMTTKVEAAINYVLKGYPILVVHFKAFLAALGE